MSHPSDPRDTAPSESAAWNDHFGEETEALADPAPVIEAIEALVRGIRRQLDPLKQAGQAGPAGTAFNPVNTSIPALVRELDAAEAQLRRFRVEFGLTEPGLEPLISGLEAQIRQVRRDLRVEPPTQPRPTEALEQHAVGSAPEVRTRRSWKPRLARAGVVLVAAAIGTWFITRTPPKSVAPAATSVTKPASSPTTEVGRSEPAAPAPSAVDSATTSGNPTSPDTPTATMDSPSNNPPVARIGSAPDSSPPASGAAPIAGGTGSFATAPSTGTPPGVEARTSITPSESVPTLPTAPAIPAGTSSAAAAADAGIAPTPAPNELPRAAPTPEPVGTTGTTGPDVRPPANPSPPREDVAVPIAPPDSPIPAVTPGAAAATSATATASVPASVAEPSATTLRSRPVTILTRIQPRMLVEVLSADMSASTVEVQVSVDHTGRTTDVRAVSGPVTLRAPAEDTVRRWTFSPALQDGEPTGGTLRVTITFGPAARDLRFRRR